MNPLLDNEFLIKLNNDKNRTIYAHVISLNQYEHPIEQLEGVVTGGSITIDGSSAVRRVCSLTLSAKNLNINNVYWGLSTKVEIEIGLQNNIIGYEKYGNIIWFRQGVFILTDFKTTQTLNNYTINLTGKDKMCMLNGDVAGNLAHFVRFDSYTDANKQSYTIKSSDNGYYNNYIDNEAANAILEGFQERYGSDYQYIRGAKKILSLSYKPSSNVIKNNLQIKFSQIDEWKNVIDLAVANTKELNTFDINLDDKDIYGFIISNADPNDEFIWTVEQKIPIAIIIQEMLHQFGQERYSNIIIKDIEPYALEMLDNGFDQDLYLLHDGDIYANLVTKDDLISNYNLYLSSNTDGGSSILTDDNGNITNIIFRNYIEEDDISLIDILHGSTLINQIVKPTEIIKGMDTSKIYTVLPVLKDEVAGYGMTLLVYPDDLTGQVGDSITSILDKIINMLGNYEYFYNLDGQFVFQAKPSYLRTAWNGTVYLESDGYISPSELANKIAYTFDDAALTTQYQNTPNLNNIKNDYIIWGEKKGASNAIKFHGRYAIENPPLEYTDFNGYTWTSDKTTSLVKSLTKKVESVVSSYNRQYNYPAGLDPNWWEVNDWANFYMQAFKIDLSKNSTMLQHYSQEKGIIKSSDDNISNFQKSFGYASGLVTQNTTTDIVVIVYTDKTKTTIARVLGHGKCVHYYAQFMDLRKLDKGWDYNDNCNYDGSTKLFNTINPGQSYSLDNGFILNNVYNPDYVDAFIYKPILPNDVNIFSSDILLDIVYPNTKNLNGHKREYASEEDVDWRHLIHIMADDWYQHHTEDDYEINLRKNNTWLDLDIDLFPYGRTNYEQYYLDFTSIGGPWQNIYDIYSIYKNYYEAHQEELANNQYNVDKYNQAVAITQEEKYLSDYFSSGAYKYWNRDVVENPENLTFWFDFFKADEMGIGKFATSVIGDRPKTINDSAIKTIIYRDTPDVIYCSWDEYQAYKNQLVLKDGYKYIIIGNDGQNYLADTIEEELSVEELERLPNNIKQNFARSIRGKSVHQQADDMLYQYSYYNDTVNISSVPIYYLQPNTTISIKDELSKIIGYYIMDKINISLAYNGMMQITAIKSPERIY